MRITRRRNAIVLSITLGACLVALAIAQNVIWVIINWRSLILLVDLHRLLMGEALESRPLAQPSAHAAERGEIPAAAVCEKPAAAHAL